MDSGCDVLAIDDDYDVLLAIQDVLEMEGYRVATARSGQEGLALLQRGLRPAVILLDLMMPDVSGWEFRAQQREDAELAKLPVVVLSGQGLSAREVADLGVDGYLKKPVELEPLLSTVARYARPSPGEEQQSAW